MSIKAVFYSKFDPLEGPKIVHQVPEDSILTTNDLSASTTSAGLNTQPLLSFPTISRFLIPRQSLCGNLISFIPPLLTPRTPPTLVLSYPVCLTSTHYPRNEFIFNFALVLGSPDTIDVHSYKSVVTKLAHLMRSLEEQSHFLSDDTSAPNTGKIASLCEILMEDLNNYCECMIPIDELNTLNIKLFPTLPNPAKVQAWHVPLFTVRIETLVDENWDLTMQRIIPFINGVNSVKRIAGLADADLKLTKKCVKHLVYYGCVILLDIFTFNAIYAPTAEFQDLIVKDSDMQRECARYVNMAFSPARAEEAIFDGSERRMSSAGLTPEGDDIWPATRKGEVVDGVGIVQLFANMRQGLTVREWYAQNTNMLANIDMRRFITFGVIKGFLYRVHRYAIRTKKSKHVTSEQNGEMLPRSMSSEKQLAEEMKRKDELNQIPSSKIIPFLDGTHCFDEICTELEISEKELLERLKRKDIGEVVTICR